VRRPFQSFFHTIGTHDFPPYLLTATSRSAFRFRFRFIQRPEKAPAGVRQRHPRIGYCYGMAVTHPDTGFTTQAFSLIRWYRLAAFYLKNACRANLQAFLAAVTFFPIDAHPESHGDGNTPFR
jgi:hypothetical protein